MTEPDENVDEPLAEPPKEEWFRPIGKRSFVWDHLKENHDRTKFKCDYCSKTFKGTTGIGRAPHHLKNMHYITHRKKLAKDSKQPSLVNALARDTSFANLKLSSTMSKSENEGKCQLCNFAGQNLKRHVMAVHAKIKDHVCNVCGQSLSCKAALNRHVSIVHFGEKLVKGLNDKLNYECDTCGSSFTQKHNLWAHKKTIHLKIKELKCKDCGACFYKTSHLHMHQKSVHLKVKDHKCGTCGKVFGRIFHLKRHEKSAHLKIKDHKCDLCELAFYDISELNRHCKVEHLHIPAQLAYNFVCKACGVAFRNRQQLTEHELATHLNIKAHECKKCDKSYFHEASLMSHYKYAHEKKADICPICQKSYNGRMKRHLLKVHKSII